MIKLKVIEVQGAWEEWEGGNPDSKQAPVLTLGWAPVKTWVT